MNKKISKDSAALFIAGIFVIIFCSIGLSLLRAYNSDDIYPYSQSIDLLTYGTLHGWHFSAVPFTVPDLFLALPAALLTTDPFVFHVLTAPLLLLVFAITYCFFVSDSGASSRGVWVVAFAGALFLVSAVGLLIFKRPWYFLMEPMFILDHHGGAAISALLVFSFLRKQGEGVAHAILLILAIVVLTVSDFFFAFYLCFFLLFNIKKSRLLKSISILSFVFGQSLIVFAISWKINPSLSVQANNSSAQTASNFLAGHLNATWHVALLSLVLWVFWNFYKNKNEKLARLTPYVYGSICAALFSSVAGLISDVYTYRYATILFPVALLVILELLLPVAERYKIIVGTVVILMPSLALGVIVPTIGLESSRTFYPEIACLKQYAPEGSKLVAEYWPAKVIFEKTHRIYNLYQVNPDGNEETWIFNDRWKTIYPGHSRTFVVMNNLSEKGRDVFRSHSNGRLLCGDRLLEVQSPN